MANQLPFEVVGAPLTLYLATPGTTYPLVYASIPGTWGRIGTNGDLSYEEDGVTVEHPQTMEPWRPAGDAGPRKYFRTEEDCKVSVVVADMTLEQIQHALNENGITTVAAAGAGTAAYKKIGLSRGLTIATRALLARAVGYSPYGAWNVQYEFPRVVNVGTPTKVWRRSGPVTYTLEFMGIVDETAGDETERFGRLVCQTSDIAT